MDEQNRKSGGELALDAARAARAIARVAKAAAAGGPQGAAVAAVKEGAPLLAKLVIALLIVLLVTPLVLLSALPNMFFGFSSSATPEIYTLTQKAGTIGGTYYNLEQFENTEIDAVVTSIANSYYDEEQEVERIVVRNLFTQDDLLWFIAISSVVNHQDLHVMSTEGVHRMSAARLQYSASLRNGTLRVTIQRIKPERWMEQLSFDETEKTWARTLYQTLSKTNALEKYASQFGAYSTNYGGETGYTGSYQHGNDYGNAIDISGFIDLSTKNAHDLAAYVIQAWENNWGYVWGTYGNVLTQSLFDYKLEQFPEGVGNYEAFIRENWLDRRTADCIGLIKGYGWLDADTLTIQYGTNGMPDYGADTMYSAAVAGGYDHGPISNMPEIVGLGLWKDGHAGVYIGNGYAIEAMGTKYGVVKTDVAGRGWTEWYKIPYIRYDADETVEEVNP